MKLREHLLEQGMTQAEFAVLLDIGRSHMSCIITGSRNPSKKVCRNIERITNGAVSADDCRSGQAFGYEGKAKRVAPCHIQRLPEKQGRKRISLI